MSIMKLTATTAAIALTATTTFARDNVQVAGSSTVLPYASIVAEVFGENFEFPTPVVESGGSSAGLKRFCEGVGANTIDIANASRAIRDPALAGRFFRKLPLSAGEKAIDMAKVYSSLQPPKVASSPPRADLNHDQASL